MTAQIEFSIGKQKPTNWQRFAAWLSNFEEAMNYDPHVQANAAISELSEGLTRLESRVNELEQSP